MSVGCAVSQHVRMRQCSTVELSLRYAYILYAESAHPLYLLLHVRMLSDIATTAYMRVTFSLDFVHSVRYALDVVC